MVVFGGVLQTCVCRQNWSMKRLVCGQSDLFQGQIHPPLLSYNTDTFLLNSLFYAFSSSLLFFTLPEKPAVKNSSTENDLKVLALTFSHGEM